jgi:hypothetical protein
MVVCTFSSGSNCKKRYGPFVDTFWLTLVQFASEQVHYASEISPQQFYVYFCILIIWVTACMFGYIMLSWCAHACMLVFVVCARAHLFCILHISTFYLILHFYIIHWKYSRRHNNFCKCCSFAECAHVTYLIKYSAKSNHIFLFLSWLGM